MHRRPHGETIGSLTHRDLLLSVLVFLNARSPESRRSDTMMWRRGRHCRLAGIAGVGPWMTMLEGRQDTRSGGITLIR